MTFALPNNSDKLSFDEWQTQRHGCVFECHLDAKRLGDLVVGLDRFAEGDDSIRVYPICESCLKRAVILGRCESFDENTFYVV